MNGVYVSMPIDANPMRQNQWNLSYQRQLPGACWPRSRTPGTRPSTSGCPATRRIPSIYIPGNCVGGSVRLDGAGPCSNTTAANRQARALLTLLNPAEGKYYAANGVGAGVSGRDGPLQRREVQRAEAPEQQLERQRQLHPSKCINQGEPGTDIGGGTFPVSLIDPINNPHPDPKTNEGAVRADRRHNFNLSAVVISPGVGPGFVDMVTKDWQVG